MPVTRCGLLGWFCILAIVNCGATNWLCGGYMTSIQLSSGEHWWLSGRVLTPRHTGEAWVRFLANAELCGTPFYAQKSYPLQLNKYSSMDLNLQI